MASKRRAPSAVDDEIRTKKPKLKANEFEKMLPVQEDTHEKKSGLSPPKSDHSSPAAQALQKEQPLKTPQRHTPPSPPATASSPDFASTTSIPTPGMTTALIPSSPPAQSSPAQNSAKSHPTPVTSGSEALKLESDEVLDASNGDATATSKALGSTNASAKPKSKAKARKSTTPGASDHPDELDRSSSLTINPTQSSEKPKPKAQKPKTHRRKATTTIDDVSQPKKAKLNASGQETTAEAKSAAGDQQTPLHRITKNGKPKKEPKKSLKGAPSITSLFDPFENGQTGVVKPNEIHDSWGKKPLPGPGGPKSHPDLPSARSSNAETVPPLWEDRGFRFRKGRYQKRVGKLADESDDDDEDDKDLPLVDQQQHLVIKLMDMRPNRDNGNQPKRTAEIYAYENGIPKDWTNHQALKALNDRRRDAISRFTCDPPWTDLEREYLTQLCVDYPDASILEYTERFNYRFKGDYKEKTGFVQFHEIYDGRTIESVRYEYLSFKKLYDRGEVPQPTREETEKINNQTQEQWLEKVGFGPKNDKDDKPKGKSAMKTKGPAKRATSADMAPHPHHRVDPSKVELPEELEEELLELAGWYNQDEFRQDTNSNFLFDSEADSSSDLSDVPDDDDEDSPFRYDSSSDFPHKRYAPCLTPIPEVSEDAASPYRPNMKQTEINNPLDSSDEAGWETEDEEGSPEKDALEQVLQKTVERYHSARTEKQHQSAVNAFLESSSQGLETLEVGIGQAEMMDGQHTPSDGERDVPEYA
ncbi:hypothetical protein K491DRAFT_712177 [Lophiostoma macrostomum CBS 122681]|uniref:Uncharacterized protein n=1 Tax=Lophiostoma macrostomum CBS 122681 TaxID=1314788 RepID=A0A6A6TJG5_9PLEO|nr:hypothetical protein K491DRAFT_712177 [Lophiostoma macrostomum CBS 122681]